MSIPVIVGPTGIGKSSLAMKLAKELKGEIVSCDSRQLYRGMDIGTAKPTVQDMEEVRHHMIDTLDPSEEYAAGRWAFDAEDAIHDIISRGKKPIICGGTFFYLSALRNGFDITTTPDREFRQKCYEREALEEGVLYRELMCENPQRAEQVHENDHYRIIRALQMIRDGVGVKEGAKEFDFTLIQLTTERSNLYERINKRVDNMVADGLFDEFQMLLNSGFTEDTPGLKCVGYREFFNYIENLNSFEESVSLIKQNSRRYAKRQLTWLRNRETPQYSFNIEDLNKEIEPLLQDLSV